MSDLPDKPTRRYSGAVYLLICAGLLLALHFYRPSPTGLWQKTFFDALHVPTFGIIAVMLLLATPTHWRKPRRFGVAFGSAIALSVLSELLQIPIERDASLSDLGADILGAAAALGLAASLPGLGLARRWQRVLTASACVVVLVFALATFLTVSAAYFQRDRLFPVLADLTAPFMDVFVTLQHATLQVADARGKSDLPWVVRLDSGAWPGLIFHDIRPDWRGFSSLVIELGVDDDHPLDITIRVHDRQHRAGDQPYRDRFNRTYELQPGHHTLRIPIADIRDAPQGRPMDLDQIDGIVIFCHAREAGREFDIGKIRLE